MLDIKLLQKNIDYVIKKLESRNFDSELLEQLSININERNKLIFVLNEKQEKRNKISSLLSTNRTKELVEEASLIKNEI
ncbi:MAG: hypothetical protein IKG09_00610, partial [Mycoplasmataceae bacterium]|nr:hypothetical protein [Mycoplasmataceae bacterium]